MPFSALPPFLSKAFILAQLTVCPLPDTAPHVDFLFAPQKPVYITDAPSAALTKAMAGNIDSTIATDSRWHVEGLMEGPIDDSYDLEFNTVSDGSNMCIFLSKVTYTIAFKPTIFIASEAKGQSCRLKVTRLHEERHVATDLRAIKEYIPKLKMELLLYLRNLGMQGPYPNGELKTQMQSMSKEVGLALRPMAEKLRDARRKRQGLIDTVENYKHESSLCPGEFPPLQQVLTQP
ncbi:MAG: hypothetical protein PW788_09450 [Micavibrio sp.]|nr:hypothetical protein [Micavibrio sp.]